MNTTMLLEPGPATSKARPEDVTSVALQSVRFGWSEGDKPDLTIDNLRIAAGERLFAEQVAGTIAADPWWRTMADRALEITSDWRG